MNKKLDWRSEGGGVRCFAHIGVLRALEEAGITITAIAGCSSGAMVGALYSAGHSPQDIYDLIEKADF